MVGENDGVVVGGNDIVGSNVGAVDIVGATDIVGLPVGGNEIVGAKVGTIDKKMPSEKQSDAEMQQVVVQIDTVTCISRARLDQIDHCECLWSIVVSKVNR